MLIPSTFWAAPTLLSMVPVPMSWLRTCSSSPSSDGGWQQSPAAPAHTSGTAEKPRKRVQNSTKERQRRPAHPTWKNSSCSSAEVFFSTSNSSWTWWCDTNSDGEILGQSPLQKGSSRASPEYANSNMRIGCVFICRNTSYNLLLCLFVSSV